MRFNGLTKGFFIFILALVTWAFFDVLSPYFSAILWAAILTVIFNPVKNKLRAALGGYIALLAPEVRNEGVIVARMGTVALASGERVTLQFDGNNSLAGIVVEPSKIKALVENKGAVVAPGGVIILSARAVDRLQGGIVRNSGKLEATGLAMKGGKIVLEASDRVENTGTVSAGPLLLWPERRSAHWEGQPLDLSCR